MDELRWEQFEDAVSFGRPLQFAGDDREIAEQFLLASAVLRDKAYSGGARGIDYEQLVMPKAPGGAGEGFGGWLSGAVPQLLELRGIAEEATANIEPWKIDAWLSVREIGPDRQTEREYSERSGQPKTTVHNAISFIDRCLVGCLRRRGFVVRGR